MTTTRKALGQKTMAYLAYKYLELKEIELAPGEAFDANKISKGLSKLYRESGGDVYETERRLRLGSEYFISKNLDWTPEAIWRRWEDIVKWSQGGNKDISERRVL